MRSEITKRILEETPEYVHQFVGKYAELSLRIHQILEEKKISKSELAERLGKKPSEISKWLNGKHNLTLKTIAKLEVELGQDLILIPKQAAFAPTKTLRFSGTASVPENQPIDTENFQAGKLAKTRKKSIFRIA